MMTIRMMTTTATMSLVTQTIRTVMISQIPMTIILVPGTDESQKGGKG